MRREALVALLLAWVAVGIAALIRSEVPRGRVVGKVVAAETGQPLPNVEVWFESDKGSWRIVSEKDGSFSALSLPADTYTVTASTRAHRLERTKFSLHEGEQRNLLIALEPKELFLELVHPQTVFRPDEPIRIGVRGFIATDELSLQVWRVSIGAQTDVPLSELLRFLDEIRHGWWRGVWELRDELAKIAPCLEKVATTRVPIHSRDAEGVFFQYVPVSLPTDGVYLVRITAENLERIALVERTPIGIIIKVGRNRNGKPVILVFASDLKTGAPVQDVTVSSWVRQRFVGKVSDRKLATDITDADGLAQLPLPNLSAIEVDNLFVTAHGNGQLMAWVSISEWDIQDATKTAPILFGTIYTDRPIYRPGNVVHFKGILREQGGGGYFPAALWSSQWPHPVKVSVRDPDGNIIHRTTVALSPFSSVSGSLTLSDEALTGSYTIEAQLNGDRITGNFVVAAYRKPEVQVSVKPTRRRFTRTEMATIEITARYYFGMPVANAKVTYWVSRYPVMDTEIASAEGWDEEYGGETILDGETRTDEMGRAVIRFRPDDLPAKTPPLTEFRYEAYVTVEAAGYQFAEGRTNFLVTQGDWRLQLWCEPSFCYLNESVTAKAKVTDWDTKKPQANAMVFWKAGMMVWRGEETTINWLMQGQTTTDEKGIASWQFTPTQIGDFVVETTVLDARKNAIGAQTNFWVTTRVPSERQPPKAPPLQIWLDKANYRVGETAKIGVRSRIADAKVLLCVEGDRLHDVQVLHLRNGVAEWRLKITDAFLPNAFVSACLVHSKKFAEQTQPIRFELSERRLQVSVKTDQAQYEPRQKAQITVQVRDANGKPVRAELSLAVVDEAIYAIREDDPEQIFRAFYAERPNRIVTRYSFPWLEWQGDKGEAETVRRYFPDTALWLPNVVTDENGEAKVTMTVPDTLTQWRITSVAHTLDTRIGFGTHRFRCAKPFGVRIAMPIVLTQNDVTTISVIVHNDTERECMATVSWQISHESGKAMTDEQSVSVPARKTATVHQTFIAERVGKWKVLVRAKSNDGKRDAEERKMLVLPHATERTLAKVIWIAPDETETAVRVVLPPNADLQNSKIIVRLSPSASVFSSLLGALEYLAQYPYGCVEQTMNSFLPDLLVWRVLKEQNIKVAWLERELPKMVQRGLMRLYRFQHSDGSWGWWEDDPADVWMTALVIRGLAEAKKAGFSVSERVLALGRKALKRELSERWQELNPDTIAFALFGLARSGEPFPKPPKHGATPVAFPAPPSPFPTPKQEPFWRPLLLRCSPYGLAFLCLAFHEWGHPEAKAMAKALLRKSIPLSEALLWTMVRNSEYGGWTTDDELTAWALLALMRTGIADAEQARKTVLTLLSHRKGEGWISTKDTAAILEALLEFSKHFEQIPKAEPTTITLKLNGGPQTVTLPKGAEWQPEQTVRLQGNLREGINEVRIAKPVGRPLLATVIVKQTLILPERKGEVLMTRKQLHRRYEKLLSKVSEEGRIQWQRKPLQANDAVRVGDLVRVTISVNCEHDYMVLEDPLPAGFRAMTRERGTDNEEEGEMESGMENGMRPKEVRDDKTVSFFRYSGHYTVSYLLRAEVPGDYHILPPRLWQMYGTERVTGAEDRLRVVP